MNHYFLSLSSMSSNRPFFNPSMMNQQNNYNAQYQTLYNQTTALKKDYDTTTDTEMKAALRIVLTKKINELQNITSVYTSTMNVQIQTITPQ